MKIEQDVTTDWSGKSTSGTTIVIDGDWLAFLGACMTDVKHFIAIDTETGEELSCSTSSRVVTTDLRLLGRSASDPNIKIIEEKRLIDGWEATARAVMLNKANKIKRDLRRNTNSYCNWR